jgi:PleD family two-component response regulator
MQAYGTVLLLNFNADERDTYRQALIAAGFDVIVCVDPLDAMRVAVARRPGALVTRVLQPNCSMDGIELVRRMKTDPRTSDVHVIATLSLAEAERRTEALDAGCDECLLLRSSVDVVAAVRGAISTATVDHVVHDGQHQ